MKNRLITKIDTRVIVFRTDVGGRYEDYKADGTPDANVSHVKAKIDSMTDKLETLALVMKMYQYPPATDNVGDDNYQAGGRNDVDHSYSFRKNMGHGSNHWPENSNKDKK